MIAASDAVSDAASAVAVVAAAGRQRARGAANVLKSNARAAPPLFAARGGLSIKM